MPSAARSKPFTPPVCAKEREEACMRGEKQHTEGARGEAPGEPRDTEGSAPLCSASYADPPGVAAVVGVFPVVSRPDEHIGAALSRPCSAALFVVARPPPSHTHHTSHTLLPPITAAAVAIHPIAIPSPLRPVRDAVPALPRAYPCCCHARACSCCHYAALCRG